MTIHIIWYANMTIYMSNVVMANNMTYYLNLQHLVFPNQASCNHQMRSSPLHDTYEGYGHPDILKCLMAIWMY